MPKHISILIFSLLIFQSAQAQKDTLLYYMKNDGEIVEQKATADYFALIVKPDAGNELFPVYEFYPNGKRKMIAASKVQSIDYQLEGTCMYFFQNGRRKAVITYKDGVPVGDEAEYYPNGKVYAISKFDGFKRLIIECRDSTGNVLAQNGDGKWLKFDPDFKQVVAEGPVAKGKQNGEWQETQGDSIKRTIVYSKGTVKSGISYKNGKAYPFKEAIVKPDAKDFSKLSAIVMNYDKDLKNATTPGVNEIIFMVDIDGSISEPKIIRSMSPELGQLLVNELKTGPKWKPGLDYGIPTRMQGAYTSEIRSQVVERRYMISVPAGSPPPQVGDKVRRQ
jgi:antitoxin component YwqK of YwqJK toxin-antitoxin module